MFTVVEYLELGFDEIREVFMREMWWSLGRVTGLIRTKPKLLRPLRSAITMQSHPSVSTSLRRASQTRSVPAPASPSRRAHQQISKVCRHVLADIQRRHVRYVFPRKRMRHPEPTSWYAHSTEMDRHPSARTSKVWTRRDQRSSAVTRVYHLLCEILVRAIDRATSSHLVALRWQQTAGEPPSTCVVVPCGLAESLSTSWYV